jgi:CopG antitoxin of type II toxin-antitoxin system
MSERTTVRLPEDLLNRAKRKAAAEGRTLTSLIEQGLRLVVSPRAEPKSARHDNPPISKARSGLRPGLNWENLSSSVQEMDDLEYAQRMKRIE